MIIGDRKIEIIQGDSYTRNITIQGVDIALIEGIYFSCETLGICKKLEYDDEQKKYILSFTSEETNNIAKFEGNYDLTIKFIDDQINTVQYQSPIFIRKKNNKVTCYNNGSLL